MFLLNGLRSQYYSYNLYNPHLPMRWVMTYVCNSMLMMTRGPSCVMSVAGRHELLTFKHIVDALAT